MKTTQSQRDHINLFTSDTSLLSFHIEDFEFQSMDEIFSQILHDSDPIQEIKNKYLNHQEFDYSEDLSTWMK